MDSLHLPDYTSLYSHTPTPYLLDGSYSSSSRNGGDPNTSTSNGANGANTSTTITAGNAQGPNNNNLNAPDQAPHHATSQSHLAILQKNAHTRALYHHSKGDHLPTRRTARGARWRKKDMRFYERERGFTWTGATLTEAEERELSDEEDARAGWRDHILAYGETNVVVLGKGKTRREEEQDRIDRGGPSASSHHAAHANAPPSAVHGHHRDPAAATNTAAIPSAGNGQPPPPNRNAQTQTGGPPPPSTQPPDDNDVFLGEYTLDHGSSDGEEGGPDDQGIFAGQDVDLDAGLESMD